MGPWDRGLMILLLVHDDQMACESFLSIYCHDSDTVLCGEHGVNILHLPCSTRSCSSEYIHPYYLFSLLVNNISNTTAFRAFPFIFAISSMSSDGDRVNKLVIILKLTCVSQRMYSMNYLVNEKM